MSKSEKLLKQKYAVQAKYESFYTNKTILVSKDGSRLYCHNGCQVSVIDLASGKPIFFLKKEDDMVHTFALPPSEAFVLLACESNYIHQFDSQTGQLRRSWRTHFDGPIYCMDVDSSSLYLATGGNFKVNVYDLLRHQYTHSFKITQGVVSVTKFRQPDPAIMQLICAGMDCKIHVLDLFTRCTVAKLSHHSSTVTCIDHSPDYSLMVSSSRDKLVIVWDTSNWTAIRKMPVLEPVESVLFLPQDQLSALNIPHTDDHHVLTAGSQGTLKVWNTTSGRMVYHQEETPMKALDESENENITKAVYVPALKSVMVATADRMILFFQLDNGLTLTKQMVGYWGPINCVRFLGPNSEYLALASSSSTVAIHHVDTFQCQLLTGHSDLVLALDVFPTDPCLLVSAGKDNTAIVWRLDPETGKAAAIFKATGHTETVTTVACTRSTTNYFASAGLDCMLKLWEMKAETSNDKVRKLTATSSAAAHDKEINALDFSWNDKLVASASRDKLIKVWSVPSLELQGTLSGHTRGIYDVKFCPTQDQLASASKDETIRIWSLSTMDCLRSLQDHQCPVLSLSYLKSGLQLAAGDVSGVLRVFDLTHKIWHKTIVLSENDAGIHSLALSLGTDDLLATTDTGSNLVLWKDVTEEEKKKALVSKQEDVEKLQDLSNCIADRRWNRALKLALQMDKAPTSHEILMSIVYSTAKRRMEKVGVALKELTHAEIRTLVNYCSRWMTNEEYYLPVLYIMPILYQTYHVLDLLEICPEYRDHSLVIKEYSGKFNLLNSKTGNNSFYQTDFLKRAKMANPSLSSP